MSAAITLARGGQYTHRTDADLLTNLLSLVDVYFVKLDLRKLVL